MREKLPERRHAINRDVIYQASKGTTKIVVTIGYVELEGVFHVREVFCADFKAGSDAQSLAVDSCILLSRLLQHGDTPQDLLEHLSSPPSIIGTICKAICDEVMFATEDGLSAGFAKERTDGPDERKNAPEPV